jgi:hypothetical protein
VSNGTDSKFLVRAGVLVLIGLGCFLTGAFLGPAWAVPGEPLSYNQFENDVKSKAYTKAVVDGNILILETQDGKRLRTEAPEVGRAVGLLIKFEVPVSTRGLPSSGLSWPVAFALLVPYGVLAFYAFALARASAAAGAPMPEAAQEDSSEAEHEDQE